MVAYNLYSIMLSFMVILNADYSYIVGLDKYYVLLNIELTFEFIINK